MLTFGAEHPFHARLDLPRSARERRAAAEALVDPAVRHRVRRVLFVLYAVDAALARSCARALVRAFTRRGVAVVDVLRSDGRCWFVVPLDPTGSESAGTPYDVTGHLFTAQSVAAGRVTRSSRDELAASVAPDLPARGRRRGCGARARAGRSARPRLGARHRGPVGGRGRPARPGDRRPAARGAARPSGEGRGPRRGRPRGGRRTAAAVVGRWSGPRRTTCWRRSRRSWPSMRGWRATARWRGARSSAPPRGSRRAAWPTWSPRRSSRRCPRACGTGDERGRAASASTRSGTAAAGSSALGSRTWAKTSKHRSSPAPTAPVTARRCTAASTRSPGC